MTTKHRISFSAYDATHLYELALEHFCVSKKEGRCPLCSILKERLEKFIGKKVVQSIRRQVRKYPYSKKGKKTH